MELKFATEYGDIIVDRIGANEDDWITIKSQSVTFDKTVFFIEAFHADFPDYTLLGSNDVEKFTFLSELCSRQDVMQAWFAGVSIRYSDTTQLPLYLVDRVAPDEYSKIQAKLLEMKDKLAIIVTKRNDLAVKYTSDLKALRLEEEAIVGRSIGQDNVLKIINLKTKQLPLSIQMKIQGYMPTSIDSDVSDNKRRLAQEYLANFKIGLLKLNESNPNIDIDKLLKEIELK
jgi:hypothetical protein